MDNISLLISSTSHFIPWCIYETVDKVGTVDLEGHAVVLLEAGDLLQGVAVDVEEEVVERRYLQMILMLIWRSTMQSQCKLIESSLILVDLLLMHLCWNKYCLYSENIQLSRLLTKVLGEGSRTLVFVALFMLFYKFVGTLI